MLLFKAFIYRIFRMIIVFLSGFLILGEVSSAVSIMSVDVLAATVFYYYFDKYWPWIEKKVQHLILRWKYRKMS